MRRLWKFILAPMVVCAASLGGASIGQTQSFLDGLPIDGVHCDRAEGTKLHIHEHLLLYNRGAQVIVPSLIGITPAAGCLYWIHTHNDDGIIHVESPRSRSFALGQFFDIWGQSLSSTAAAGAVAPRGGTLRIWINNKPFTGNVRSLLLRNRTDIVIMSGPPFKGLPRLTDWKALKM